ncbi:hypothetical protein K378_02194 [Streptomyces sp. Amel2xB2]|uniref:DUF8175 domain-containing protein n=1 Tax=Streptomyces nanshensis TaxID=518642 RepID=A0A1E7KYN5_9ACTN|nr:MULTISPECIES: hypothetical protein [Streptomyces]OEV09024.1 hypothetical protein AN218_24135 [Streptomyces nanshensis]RAJ66831.1 hypothetical protein K378_02194 [Streptomyces sp. Amel2xB2]
MSIGEGYGERDRTGDEGAAGGFGRGPSGLTTTRTRLPGSEGGGRPPSRPGRSVVTVIGVVVLLIAAIAFANQGGDGGDDDTADGKDGAAARPTAPTGQKPVKGGKGGIASGFPQTRQGAESAAANYAVALVSSDIIKPDKRPGLVQQIFAPDKADKMRSRMDKAYSSSFLKKLGLDADGNPDDDMTYISRTTPIGTKTAKFDKDKAQLDVWCTGLYGLAGQGSKNPVTSDWFTMRLGLEWVSGDWKVAGFQQKDGPAPVEGDNRASGAEEIADAVGQYGGFTYGR